MKFDQSPPDDAAIAQGLASLKRQGGTVLVVGAATTAHADACERFLGDDHAQVFVRTDRVVRPDEDTPETAAVVERAVPTRSASSASTGSPVHHRSLADDVDDAVRAAAAEADTTRVCFDSLRPLMDTTDRPALITFLDAIQTTAKATNSVVHFHLPAMVEAIPSALFDAVDAVVELNCRGHVSYQQWYLPDSGDTSEWVEV